MTLPVDEPDPKGAERENASVTPVERFIDWRAHRLLARAPDNQVWRGLVEFIVFAFEQSSAGYSSIVRVVRVVRVFRVVRLVRLGPRMPVVVAFFIWIAENVATRLPETSEADTRP